MKIGAFERRHQPLASRRRYLRRLASHAALGAAFIGGALSIGVLGYHFCAGLGWIDAIHNASMILSGMGPVDPMPTTGSKLFASTYAIFSGVVFIGTVGVVLAPVIHRFLHRLHLEESHVDGED